MWLPATPSEVTRVSPSLCWPAAPSGHVLSACTTFCSEIYVWTSGESIQLCGRNERSFLLFPFFFFSLPSAFCPPKEAKRIGERPRIHAEKNSKKYQPALNSYFSHKGRVGASGPGPFSGKSQKGTRMRSGKGSRGGRGRVGVWGQALVTNEECYAEESRSWNSFVLPIWWGCNYRRIELTRHGGPFPLTFTSFLCNNLWEKS